MLYEMGNLMRRHGDVVLSPADKAATSALLPNWKIGRRVLKIHDTQDETSQRSFDIMERRSSKLYPPNEFIGRIGKTALVKLNKLSTGASRVTLFAPTLLAAHVGRAADIEKSISIQKQDSSWMPSLVETPEDLDYMLPPVKTREITIHKRRSLSHAEKIDNMEKKTDLSNLPAQLKVTPERSKVLRLLALPNRAIAHSLGKKEATIEQSINLLMTANQLSREQLMAVGVRDGLIDLSGLPSQTAQPLTRHEKSLLPMILHGREVMATVSNTTDKALKDEIIPGLFAKLGVQNKTQAYLIGLRDGFIPIPGYIARDQSAK